MPVTLQHQQQRTCNQRRQYQDRGCGYMAKTDKPKSEAAPDSEVKNAIYDRSNSHMSDAWKISA